MLDLPNLVLLFHTIKQQFNIKGGVVEMASPMPKQGVASMFRYGEAYGSIRTAICAAGIPHALITPYGWKKVMLPGMPKGKGSSLLSVRQTFPEFTQKITDHEAEAILMAELLRRNAIIKDANVAIASKSTAIDAKNLG
jgi:hypothetical protein